jgi:hypothetical protein
VGLDFITTCTPTFQRSWDRGREELLEPNLFRRHPQLEGRTFRLSPAEGAGLREGDEVLLRWCGEELVAYRDRARVGVVASPPQSLLQAVEQVGGALCAYVNHVHPRSGEADASLIS